MPKLPSLETCSKLFTYDPDTGLFTWNARDDMSKKWNARYSMRPTFTATDKDGYKYSRFINPDTGKAEKHLAHRVAFLMHTGREPSALMDHANGDRSDNRASNLREATRSQNNRNTSGRSGRSSGFIGVHLIKKTGKWRAMIGVNGRSKHIGVFDTEKEAAEARDREAATICSTFSRLNFPSFQT